MGLGVATEEVSTSLQPQVAGNSLRVTGLVARAHFWVAEDSLFQQREHARVPRDHLPQPVHPSARSIEKRVDGPLAVEAARPGLAALEINAQEKP
jgi:hypothetical protein